MENLNFTENEEKTLVGILYNHISFGTSLEVFGELSQEGVSRLDGLRNILSKLFKKYGLVEKLSDENYLLLGMADFVKKDILEEWQTNENNKHLQNRAIYFLKKRYG